MNCERSCEAPSHVDKCPCPPCPQTDRIVKRCRMGTDDHFTPQSIQKLERIKDTPENHQWLSKPCHQAKDADTPMRGDVLRLERSGIIFTWEQHRQIFVEGVRPRVLLKTLNGK